MQTRHRFTCFTVLDRPLQAPSVDRLGEVLAGAGYRSATWGRGEERACCVLTSAGQLRVEDERGAYLGHAAAGTIFCFRSDHDRFVYRRERRGDWRGLFVNLAGGAAVEIIGRIIAQHGPLWDCDRSATMRQTILAQLPPSGHRQRLQAAEASIAMAQRLLDHLLASSQTLHGGERGVIEQGMAHMLADLADPPAIAQVAEQLGISREYFTRCFQQVAGQSPSRWLRQRRLQLACDLLRDSELPVAAVAQACGFAGTASFCKAFRKAYGRSPQSERS